MSKIYRDLKTKPTMRKHSQRPGKTDKDGNLIYQTEQAHKYQTDINKIIKKYDKNGLITHVSKFEAQFGNVSGIEFKTAQDNVLAAKKSFNQLPSEIRKRFQNNPSELLTFMDNPENRQEAIDLGIINPSWTEETDGLGEHIKEGENKTESETSTKKESAT